MYKCSLPKVIYDPYEVFPSYGESEVKISCNDSILSLDISYEDSEREEEKILKLEFEFPVFYRLESFPGVNGMDIEYDGHSGILSSLLEYSYSEYRDAWERHFDNRLELSHYQLFFLSENKRFEVVSKKVRVVRGYTE